jgi:hypothetical protein
MAEIADDLNGIEGKLDRGRTDGGVREQIGERTGSRCGGPHGGTLAEADNAGTELEEAGMRGVAVSNGDSGERFRATEMIREQGAGLDLHIHRQSVREICSSFRLNGSSGQPYRMQGKHPLHCDATRTEKDWMYQFDSKTKPRLGAKKR